VNRERRTRSLTCTSVETCIGSEERSTRSVERWSVKRNRSREVKREVKRGQERSRERKGDTGRGRRERGQERPNRELAVTNLDCRSTLLQRLRASAKSTTTASRPESAEPPGSRHSRTSSDQCDVRGLPPDATHPDSSTTRRTPPPMLRTQHSTSTRTNNNTQHISRRTTTQDAGRTGHTA
jgi:hypothetical protein